jgi:tricorn protease
VVNAGEKPKDSSDKTTREAGWLDLERIRVSIEPRAEWRQMYREAWRLQRDQFWTEDMASVDWNRVNEIYEPLLDRVATRGEFSDLLWEMQGELGTSHAYEYGGDYRPAPSYDMGVLGAHYEWDPEAGGYRITRILQGDPGEPGKDSPLNRVGADIRVGDVILTIGGQHLTETVTPDQALVHQAGLEVQLTLASRDGGEPRRVSVKTLSTERPIRYREWVDTNRKRVHEATDGRIGYLHIPDMGAAGYAEFHRGFLVEAHRDGLIVDVRYNGGGHVSQLLLEKLGRKRLGYDVERWGAIKPYPDESIVGPMVAITNEHAGSDGDVFSHCFKLLGLGPLVGKRTWGGVVGVWPRHALVDGTLTTQPEFAFWFEDVGWSLENHGTVPDVELDIKPQDYAAHRDPQLEQAIAMTLEALKAHPPEKPDFSKRPNLAPPKLPPRDDGLTPLMPGELAPTPSLMAAAMRERGGGGGGQAAESPEEQSPPESPS